MQPVSQIPEFEFQAELFEKLAQWFNANADAQVETPEEMVAVLREAAKLETRLAASCLRAREQMHRLIDRLESPRRSLWHRLWPF